MADMRGPRLLREWRLGRGLTQLQAAMHLGTTKLQVCLLEGGKRTPSLPNAFSYQDATDGEVPARSWAEQDEAPELAGDAA